MLSVFAEFETALRSERELEGIAKARKPETQKRAQELRAQGCRPALKRRSASAGRRGDTSTRRPLNEAELSARQAS